MFQYQMVNTIVGWERRLQVEEEKRKNHRYEPYVNYLAPLERSRQERRSIFTWLLALARRRKPEYPIYPPAACRESQVG